MLPLCPFHPHPLRACVWRVLLREYSNDRRMWPTMRRSMRRCEETHARTGCTEKDVTSSIEKLVPLRLMIVEMRHVTRRVSSFSDREANKCWMNGEIKTDIPADFSTILRSRSENENDFHDNPHTRKLTLHRQHAITSVRVCASRRWIYQRPTTILVLTFCNLAVVARSAATRGEASVYYFGFALQMNTQECLLLSLQAKPWKNSPSDNYEAKTRY